MLDLLRQLAGEGVSIVYISHRLDEVGRIADDLTVMRDGRTVSTGPAGEYDVARMVREMVGRDVDTVFPALRDPGSGTLLSARDLTPAGDAPTCRDSTSTYVPARWWASRVCWAPGALGCCAPWLVCTRASGAA